MIVNVLATSVAAAITAIRSGRTARAAALIMQVTMSDLFFRGGTDRKDRDVKFEVFASHGVVQVELNGIFG